MRVEKLVVGQYRENCYLLIKNNNCIVIDPGDEFDKIYSKIENLKVNVVGILITHAHFDHIGALSELIEKYNVPIYYNNVNKEIIYDKLVNIEEKNYNLKDFNFEVIYTKGHRNDSVTYYFYEENIMFTGDFIFKDTIGRTDLEYADVNEMKKSIEKIKKYDNNILIYPGHENKTTLGYEKKNNPYFSSIMQ